ncbi:MAG: radical SAM protein [Ignavibacteria bacterium]
MKSDPDFLDILLKKASEQRQPASGMFELTTRCNLACMMCYVAEHACSKSAKDKEMTAEDWIRIAEDGVQNGLVFITLTGGEIFLRPDFFKIYEPIRKMGTVLNLYTNGNLITKSAAERLSAAPPNKIEITLYGATQGTYETVTKNPKGYKLCCDGIENLLSVGINPVLKTTIIKQNKHELDAMRKMAHDWGLPFLSSWLLTERTDGAVSGIKESRLMPEEIIQLEKEDRISSRELYEISLQYNKSETSKTREEIFYCSAGKSSFMISADGKMNACLDLPQPAAPVQELGFKKAWEKVCEYIEESTKKTSTCSTCSLNSICNTCPAASFLESKTLNEPVPYLCEVTKQRNEVFGIKGQ